MSVDVYFVRHAESCSNISDYTKDRGLGKITQPPLSYKGMQQAINLGINNNIINMDFDKYYCSPSLRTIMTACLSLRTKCYNKEITLNLNSYLIEHKNSYANFGNDQQNMVVPLQKLMNMIEYIKTWFQLNYFNNYIDYEFLKLMYDLTILLYLNNSIVPYASIIKNLLKPIHVDRKRDLSIFLDILEKDNLKIESKKTILLKNNINNDIYDIYNNINLLLDEYDVIKDNFTIYYEVSNRLLEYDEIIKQLNKFSSEEINFTKNIKFNYKYNDQDETNLEKFIKEEIIVDNNKNKKILCFTHGSALKNYFNLNNKLDNTEIVHYNYNFETNDKTIKTIFNNNIIINKQLIIDTCGDLLILYPKSSKYKMFKVINNYFNNLEYNVNEDTDIDDHFNLLEDGFVLDLDGGKYKDKYLKYKKKYFRYKKNNL